MAQRTKILLALLALFGVFSVSAEEIAVRVSGDRAAVLHIVDAQAGDPEISGSLESSLDLANGVGAARADLVLHEAAELAGAEIDLYGAVKGPAVEMVGLIDMPLPKDETAPKGLKLDVESKTEGDQSAANYKLEALSLSTGDAAPSGKAKYSIKGDFRSFTSSGHFDMAGGALAAERMPFDSLEISIVETKTDGEGEAGGGSKTKIQVRITAEPGSEIAGQLAGLPVMAGMLEGNLKANGIQYEDINFAPPVEEDGKTVSVSEITLVGLRDVLRPNMAIAAQQMAGAYPPDVNVQQAFESMLEVRFDEFRMELVQGEENVSGKLTLNVSSLDSFYNGYLTLLPAMSTMGNEELIAQAGEFGPMLQALLEISGEQSAQVLRLLVSSDMKMEGDFALELRTSEGAQDGEAPRFDVLSDGNLLFTGYSDFVAKAKAAELPVTERAVGMAKVELSEDGDAGQKLDGELFVYSDGDLLNYYKKMLAEAATRSDAPPEVHEAFEQLQIEEIAMKLGVRDGKVNLLGRSKTSDLTRVMSLISRGAVPQLEGDVTGLSLNLNMPEPGQGELDAKVFLANFLPGQDEAAIREALGLPASAQVSLDASSEDVTLVAVEQPEVEVDGKLAQVRSAGESLLASSPSEVASGGSRTEGGMRGLIGLGALIFLGVIGFALFGRKSST